MPASSASLATAASSDSSGSSLLQPFERCRQKQRGEQLVESFNGRQTHAAVASDSVSALCCLLRLPRRQKARANKRPRLLACVRLHPDTSQAKAQEMNGKEVSEHHSPRALTSACHLAPQRRRPRSKQEARRQLGMPPGVLAMTPYIDERLQLRYTRQDDIDSSVTGALSRQAL